MKRHKNQKTRSRTRKVNRTSARERSYFFKFNKNIIINVLFIAVLYGWILGPQCLICVSPIFTNLISLMIRHFDIVATFLSNLTAFIATYEFLEKILRKRGAKNGVKKVLIKR